MIKMCKRFYLAYGSNLNIPQMQRRCPTAKIVGVAEIEDYELLFKGSKTGSYLTIEPKKGATVPVAVWEIKKADEKSLDQYEGFPRFYYKKDFRVRCRYIKSGRVRTLNTFAYIMDERRQLERILHQHLPERLRLLRIRHGADFSGNRQELKRIEKEEGSQKNMKDEIRTNERICPHCGKTYHEYPALSRIDNKTLLCPDCGSREALSEIGISTEEQEAIIATMHRYHDKIKD